MVKFDDQTDVNLTNLMVWEQYIPGRIGPVVGITACFSTPELSRVSKTRIPLRNPTHFLPEGMSMISPPLLRDRSAVTNFIWKLLGTLFSSKASI